MWAVSSIGGGGGGASADKPQAGGAAARRARSLLPRYRLVAYYGAPQHDELGALGIGTPDEAGAQAARARPSPTSARAGRCMPAFELIVTLAQADPGDDGLYRLRQTPEVIRRYLTAVRADQGNPDPRHPARAVDFIDEVKLLEP